MSALPPADAPGEAETVIGGVTVRPGAKVVLRPSRQATGQDTLLVGRSATVERIYRDYDDRIQLGVTVDDDPGQELMREIGRFLFFDPSEVEVTPP
jgi:hypothetical protein